MKKLLFIICSLCFMMSVYAQEITTVILVRHAEKVSDGSKDPELTDAGKARAEKLSGLLKEVKVDAIYSTAYKRTQGTVAPLALSKKLTVATYEPMKGLAIDEIIKKNPGGTIVICGHSNTTPWTANYLLGKEQFKDFEETDFDNLLILDLVEKGKAKITWLTY